MAKIDCSVTMNYLREFNRMCNSHEYRCRDCSMDRHNNGELRYCGSFIKEFPERAVEIVQKWSDEHPVKTRLDDLLERCPNVPLDGEGFPHFSPSMLGYCGDCDRCRNWKNPDMRNCWGEPLVGGATGKAVE